MSELNGDAIRAVAELAERAKSHETLSIDNRRQLIFFNGEIKEQDSGPPPRRHRFGGFDDLVNSVPDEAGSPLTSVWVNRRGVTVLYDDQDRADMGFWRLNDSEILGTMVEADNRSYTHEQWVDLLRIKLHGAIEDGLASQFSRVNFSRKGSGASEQRSGKESLGRSIENEIQGMDQLPDSIMVQVPLWEHPDVRYYSTHPVRCLVTLRATDESFRLTMEPCAEANIEFNALRSLRDRLIDALPQSRVFIGEPGQVDWEE